MNQFKFIWLPSEHSPLKNKTPEEIAVIVANTPNLIPIVLHHCWERATIQLRPWTFQGVIGSLEAQPNGSIVVNGALNQVGLQNYYINEESGVVCRRQDDAPVSPLFATYTRKEPIESTFIQMISLATAEEIEHQCINQPIFSPIKPINTLTEAENSKES